MTTSAIKFCTNHNKNTRSEGGKWIVSRNGIRRWLCASCLAEKRERLARKAKDNG